MITTIRIWMARRKLRHLRTEAYRWSALDPTRSKMYKAQINEIEQKIQQWESFN